MSQEREAKRLRKGTKSCRECRHRKIRCTWPLDTADACQNCLARGRACEPQIAATPTSEAARLTSRSRIIHLEGSVSSLWTAVRNIEVRLGYVPSAYSPSQSSPRHTHLSPDKDDDSDSNSSDLSPGDPPTHLLQLFNNPLLGSRSDGPASPRPQIANPQSAQQSASLQRLMPSREDMLTITAHAEPWLSMYNSFLPMMSMAKTSNEMLDRYDRLQGPNADPVAVASLLLSVAITIEQVPNNAAEHSMKSIGNVASFIKDVSDTVERVVVADDNMAATLEGIETSLLFSRLQLGRAKVKEMWLLSRRIIALAGLIGLPRASAAMDGHGETLSSSTSDVDRAISLPKIERLKWKAEVWESICALDRITSMMWSLPLATADHPPPKRPVLDSDGKVIPRSYIYSLADFASSVSELDNIYIAGGCLTPLVNAVVAIDEKMRTLASLTPKGWWRSDWSGLSVDALLQYWHQYILVRIHLRLALADDMGQKFPSNFITCYKACHQQLRLYVSLRPLLPTGFFANRVMDLQAFTATVFLLLTSHRATKDTNSLSQAVNVEAENDLIDKVELTMESAFNKPGAEFVKQARGAVSSLRSLLQQPPAVEPQKLILHLPLVGKITVSRKSKARRRTTFPGSDESTQHTLEPAPSSPSSSEYQNTASGLSGFDCTEPLSYSMEIPDDFSFLADETFGTEDWLSWMEAADNS